MPRPIVQFFLLWQPYKSRVLRIVLRHPINMETSANADTTSDWENYFKSPFLDMLKCCVSDVFLNRRGGVIKIKDWRTRLDHPAKISYRVLYRS